MGHAIDPHTGAIASPIYLSTTYERNADGSYPRGYSYSRTDNPNRHNLETVIAGLEGGTVAAAFSSGLAAIGAVFQALSPGDHVIAPEILYHGTTRILKDIFSPWNLQVSFVDTADKSKVKSAVRDNTKIIFVETPSNPTLSVTDIKAIAGIAHTAGAICVCDNTWATPVLQRPLELGADLVIHSTTKYFGGHSDVLGGAVVGSNDDEFFGRIRKIQQIGGAVPSPFDAWLLLRGAQTLPCRIRNHSESALKISKYLSNHPQVERVYYPGLSEHPGHEIARKQMSQFGGMLSFEVKGDKQRALEVTGKLKIIIRGTSLGGVESLIEHRASIEGPESRTPNTLLRLSVGLENVDDLIDDLSNALG
ncbi:Cystathionine gamma-synthase [Sporomusa silvacetica DSM 10669]|uniref:Cystathionine gamma-synthase n=1 Tax=Sporomusa silvacetica DSM 10669 TaxID=1123289 RepID=A0ABZ3IH25_9FIRM|nr:cystathionine gamma-synthase [Sporomusa silvacetica DSM 10669]